MSFHNIAQKVGVTSHDITDITNGNTSYNIALKLGLTSHDIQDILSGKTSYNLAQKLGLTSHDLEDLLSAIGEKGGSGLIIGLLLCT